MKTKIISILLAGFFLVSAVRAQPVSVSIGYQSFYDELSPYGTWVNYPGYGYVWKYRNSNMSFRPYYSRGHWVFTEYGWTWASDYSWGWATFHYGRWFYDDYMGWLWIPGNEWAPAWVTWGSYNNDFCWAPIGPNIDISVNAGYRPPANYWSACPGAYFGRSDWYGYGVNISHNTTIVNNITIIRNNNNSVRYSRGPEAGAVEKYTRTAVRPVAVADNNRPGADKLANNRLAIYRPAVQQANASRSAPKHFENPNKYRPVDKPIAGAEPYRAPSNAGARPANPSSNPSATNRPSNPPVNRPVHNSPGAPTNNPMPHNAPTHNPRPHNPPSYNPAPPNQRPSMPPPQQHQPHTMAPPANRPAQPSPRQAPMPAPHQMPAPRPVAPPPPAQPANPHHQ